MAKEINKIVYGGRTFYQDSIKNGNMYLAASLLSEQLEVNTLEFDLVSDDTSLTNFIRNDKLTYFYNGRQTAIFYLQNVERTGPRMYHFSANSAVGLLMEGLHYGGIYTGQTVEEVLPGIMGSVPYYIKSNLVDIKLYGWLPVAAPRDNLSQVLFAIGATVKTDLDGYLRIESFWDSVSCLTGKDRIYSGAKISYTATVTSVVVTEHQYVQGEDSSNLFEGTAAEGDIVTFNEPVHELSASGFTILESGANYAKLSAGSGTLTGKRYIHNTRQIVKEVAQAHTPNVKKVENATLISLVNSQATAERLVSFYKWLETVDAAVVYSGEKPGDRVQIYHPYDRAETTACLQSADITLSNVLKAQEKALVGYVPPVVGDITIYEYREVLSGSGRWIIPDGVSTLRAVLIGGGSGGQGGGDGDAGADSESSQASAGSFSSSIGGAGGQGGEKGVGGSGGKVYITDIEIPEGTYSLQFSCGAGGAGGAVNGGAGRAGNDTTLRINSDVYSSADGSASDIGYNDVQTGDIYALPGQAGYAGGKGGDGDSFYRGGSGSSRGDDGESVGGYAGGAGSRQDYHEAGTYATSPYIEDYPASTSVNAMESRTGGTNYTLDSRTGKFTITGNTTVSISTPGGRATVYTKGSYPPWPNSDAIYKFVYSRYANTPTTGAYAWDECKRNTIAARPTYASPAVTQAQYGAGGGGAAWGNAGGSASEGYPNTKGGDGADSVTPAAPAVYGSGGSGGNGGGGGGGGGGSYVSVHEAYTGSGYVSARGSSGGTGGKGSAGGAGAPGCVILYYGVPHVVSSGWLKDRDGKYFIGRYHRRFVV